MTLGEARRTFTILLCRLVLWAEARGYGVAFAEGMDRVTVKDPTTDHMRYSLHESGLAQDLDLYKDGVYLTTTEDHRELGEHWEKMHPMCKWGGRFKNVDGNHYSFCPPELVGSRR